MIATHAASISTGVELLQSLRSELARVESSGQAETAGTAVDTLLWVIVEPHITLLGMALAHLF